MAEDDGRIVGDVEPIFCRFGWVDSAGSPPYSHFSVGHHSRESSTSRFSGSLKPGSRKINPNDGGSGGNRHPSHKGQKLWKECDVIEEEGLPEDLESRKPLPRRCYFLAFVVGFFSFGDSVICWLSRKSVVS